MAFLPIIVGCTKSVQCDKGMDYGIINDQKDLFVTLTHCDQQIKVKNNLVGETKLAKNAWTTTKSDIWRKKFWYDTILGQVKADIICERPGRVLYDS